MSDPREVKIRDRAYHLWREHGCAEGQDWNFWLQAEREILGDDATGVPPAEPLAKKPRAAAKPKADAAAKPKAPAKPKAAAKPKAPAKPKSPLT